MTKIKNPVQIAVYKQKCLDYLYHNDEGRWAGVGCTVDPRIDVTYEGSFPHSIKLTTSFHTKNQGIGYLRDRNSRDLPTGVECEVGALEELDLWKRFLRLMKLAYENLDSYKVYCIRKKRVMDDIYFNQYLKMERNNRNDWLQQTVDKAEDDLLTYAESLNPTSMTESG